MNRLLIFSSALLLPALLGAGDKDEAGGRKSDIVLIQGAWRVESVRKDGKPMEEGVGDFLIFANNRLTFEPRDQKEAPEELEFALDVEQSPKHLDWKFDFDGQQVTIHSIYNIEGASMTICHGEPDQPHPKSFDDKNVFVYQLKRTPRAGQ